MTDRIVFVIRDFEVGNYVGLALQYLAEKPPKGTRLQVPGIPGASEQGRLLEDIVDRDIARSQHVISFMDTPNANVGWEVGFALGSDRKVALVCAATELPSWLDGAPLAGYLITRGVQLPKLRDIVEKQEHITVSGEPGPGEGVLFLAPRTGEGLVGHEIVSTEFPEWRSPDETGWHLTDLPQQLEGIGEVVWLITPYAPDSDRRDGQGNSLNAVVAGYAKGKGIPLRILKSRSHRRVSDIEDQANVFAHLHELRALLQVAEDKRQLTLSATSSEEQDAKTTPALERMLGETNFRSHKWLRRSLDYAKAVGRLSIRGSAAASCFLISPRHVLTPAHVVSTNEQAAECAVLFEQAGKSVRGATRYVRNIIWTHPTLDATILELDEPMQDVTPLVISKNTSLRPGANVVVIGYPWGGSLSFSLTDSGIVHTTEQAVHYRTPTAPGSSGSPIFDEDWKVIAMHHGSTALQSDSDPINEGIRATAILSALRTVPSVWTAVFGSPP